MSETTFYHRVDSPGPETGAERFRPTEHTVSTWADTMQHGAPPSALLVRALERCEPRTDTRLSRFCVELLGPVPMSKIEVRARVERPGRQIELLTAELWAEGPKGPRAVARANAWRLQTLDTSEVAHASDASLPAPDPDAAPGEEINELFRASGYVQTVDWHVVTPPGSPGPASAWMRTRASLVHGEEMTPLQRVFSVADAANGVGARLDATRWTFINTELTVHLFRAPRGEWTGVSAESSVGPDGIGMTAGVLHDVHGPIGRIHQNVLVRPR
ncbi:thioesterase family protein [Nocardiopsis algeriensis]|uniref:thioesterase family protein n=1 Tax=Nocardiopsis algeriensis TaxID=1478215 RepID=UPI003B438009